VPVARKGRIDLVSTLREYDVELRGCVRFLLPITSYHTPATTPIQYLTVSAGQEPRHGQTDVSAQGLNRDAGQAVFSRGARLPLANHVVAGRLQLLWL